MGKIDEDIARQPGDSPAAVHALGLVDTLLLTVDGSGLSRRAIAAACGVSAGTLTGWARHDSWPTLLALFTVADQVGLRLAWQYDDIEGAWLGPDGSRQLAIEGLQVLTDVAVREWWPGGDPGDPIEGAVMRLGAEIAWRRVHVLRWEVALCARTAGMDPDTWRAVERGVHGRRGGRSSPGLNKVAAAVLFVTAAKAALGAPAVTASEGRAVPLGWRSADVPLPLAPWEGASGAERDNLILRHRRRRRVQAGGQRRLQRSVARGCASPVKSSMAWATSKMVR